ncbi:MAG: DUF1553 domain-containing protein [Planctomycetales bacterium]
MDQRLRGDENRGVGEGWPNRLRTLGSLNRRRPTMRFGIPSLAMLVVAGSVLIAGTPLVEAADPVATRSQLDFFEKKIRPVLVKHCYECHAADSKKIQGELLVDSREGLIRGGESGPAVKPGDLKESLLISALKHDDFEMPPKGKLPDSVIADFEQWIQQGAADPRKSTVKARKTKTIDLEAGRKHWAYQPIKAPPIPSVNNASWPAGEIDRFILAKLEENKIQPTADADKVVLVRRIYFDLIGLPPSPEQIDAFVNDPSPKAFENLVDRLLASPRFGERWGRHWLDVTRFAESVTLRGIMLKHAWRYRDYVIETFNDDRPFDQFLTEQIAGDLLTESSIKARRRNVIATTFLMMGNTNLEEQDKNQLEMDFVDEQLDVIGKGLLGQTITCARCHDHKFDPIPTLDYYAMAGVLKNVQGLKHSNVSSCMEVPLPLTDEAKQEMKRHEQAAAELKKAIAALKKQLKPEAKGQTPASNKIIAAASLPGIVIDDDDVKVVGEWKHSVFSKHYIGKGYRHDENKGKGEKTLSFIPKLPADGKYEVRFAYQFGGNRPDAVPVTVFSAEGEKTIIVNQRQSPPLDGRFISLGTYRFEAKGQSFVLISNEGTDGFLTADAVQFLPEGNVPSPVVKADDKKPNKTVDQPGVKKQLAALEAELKQLIKNAPARAMAMSVVETKKPQDLRIHIRGSTGNLGDVAPRGVLQVAHRGPAIKMPSDGSGRLELARWIADSQNPLTARVMANRVWHWMIGAGIVRTVDNFGATGEAPSHPALIDHLASRFIDEGWSVKKLIRAVALSRTYRLASSAPPKSDPENRLLSRMNHRRLDAESLRDAMLLSAGSLSFEMGGPTFPPSLANHNGFQFRQARRSVYAPVFRNSLPELFEVFDFANPSMVVGRRNVSTVAPQALFLMNSPFVRTQAKLTAERLLGEKHDSQESRVNRACQIILGRPATSEELALGARFLKSVSDASEQAETEAWTQLAQSLFSTIEFRYLR